MAISASAGMSQTIGEAFYVYRNDGMINTFYRSEIDSISFSYYDADSVLYDEIVSQVVYTPDSIFQIPLAIIDSVGFVTPETKYKPDVIRLEGVIRNYILGSDSLTVFFRSDTPSDILPKVGDKLVTTEMSKVFAGGFIGQVEEIEQNGDTIFLNCDVIGIEEVFECFYYSTNGKSQGNPQTARAIEWDWNNYYAPGPFAFSFTSFLDANFTPIDCPFKISPKLDVAIAPTFMGKGSIIVHPLRGVVINMDIKQHTSFTMDMVVSGEKNVKRDFAPEFMPMYPILPFVYIYGDVGFFIEANIKLALEEHLNQSLDYNIHYEASYLPIPPLPITTSIPKFKITNVNLTTEHNTKFMADGYIAGGIFGEIGIVPFLTKHIAKAGFRFEGGIKLGGDVIIYNSDGMNSLSSTSPYERLKSGELYVKPFCRVGMGARLLGVGKGEVNLFEKDWDLGRFKLVPDFTNTKLTRNEDNPSTLIATTTAFGSTIFPCSLGFKMFDGAENDGFKGIYSHSYLGITGEPETYWDSFSLMPLIKNYSVYPTVDLFGIEMLASPSAELKTILKPITLHVEDITDTTAKVWGRIDGYELIDETMTFGLGYEEVGGAGTVSYDASSIDENGTFSVEFMALKPNTTYKYFAYLKIGGETYYGEDKEFTTKNEENREAYYVYNSTDCTTTLYYDGMRQKRYGQLYSFGNCYCPYESVKVIFDSSFSNYYPKNFTFNSHSWNHSKLQIIENIEYLNTDSIFYMDRMFWNCSSLKSLDLSNFNTSNAVSMSGMFTGCSSLTSLDLRSFNTFNVTNMSYMFRGCSSLKNINLSSFNTENVTLMGKNHWSDLTGGMFEGCSSLTSLDLSSFNTSNVTDMYRMFYGCSSLKILNLSYFDTSNVQDMEQMFSRCASLTSLDLSNFNTASVKYMNGVNIGMFFACSSLTTLDLSSFDTSNISDMGGFFRSCTSLRTIYARDWKPRGNSSLMFDGCINLVGGQGTKIGKNLYGYDENGNPLYYYCSDDGTAAHIDSGMDNPGLFTAE